MCPKEFSKEFCSVKENFHLKNFLAIERKGTLHLNVPAYTRLAVDEILIKISLTNVAGLHVFFDSSSAGPVSGILYFLQCGSTTESKWNIAILQND
jgi:hypothetical protein